MPNITLVAINAKYIQSSYAAYSLHAYLSEDEKRHVSIQEFTVNQSEEFIISEICRQEPDVLAFSCYIWNIGMVLSIIDTFRKISPDMLIIAGGPEASFEYQNLVEHGANVIVEGEGEVPFKEIVKKITAETTALRSITSGLPSCTIQTISANAAAITSSNLPALTEIPFVYTTGFDTLKNRLVYYETSRGCANKCGYCMSSASTGVRFLPWERVEQDLNKFLEARIPQVKFVDRTFNASKDHTMRIWKHLIANDNGITNFHFEIAGDMLDEEMLHTLTLARNGLFQFEIGVQSTNENTLTAIRRRTNTAKLFSNVKRLLQSGNIHLHLDLIAGLPYENFESFKKSFNDVFAYRPHKLQLGFLKLLKGSDMRNNASTYGIVYKSQAPYSVIKTNDISFAELNMLHKIEHMVETFYNATGFQNVVAFMLQQFATPLDFFHTLALAWEKDGFHLVSHKKMAIYSFLHKFGTEFLPNETMAVSELLKFDMLLQESVRAFPSWITCYYTPNNQKISRTTAMHIFKYDILTWHSAVKLDITATLCPSIVELCFDYTKPVLARVSSVID